MKITKQYKRLKTKNIAEMKKRNDGTMVVQAKQFDPDTGEETQSVKELLIKKADLEAYKAKLEQELESVDEMLSDISKLEK